MRDHGHGSSVNINKPIEQQQQLQPLVNKSDSRLLIIMTLMRCPLPLDTNIIVVTKCSGVRTVAAARRWPAASQQKTLTNRFDGAAAAADQLWVIHSLCCSPVFMSQSQSSATFRNACPLSARHSAAVDKPRPVQLILSHSHSTPLDARQTKNAVCI